MSMHQRGVRYLRQHKELQQIYLRRLRLIVLVAYLEAQLRILSLIIWHLERLEI